MPDDQLATRLCELYAIWSSHQICRCMGMTCECVTTDNQGENRKDSDSCVELPKPEAVEKAVRHFLDSLASADEAGIPMALKEMGVFDLLPHPEGVFRRMEGVAARVSGLAQQVFLVELAFLAVGVGDHRRAKEYIQQARTFEPSSRELYGICIIEGLIALNDANVGEAIRCLEQSTKACQTDVDSSIRCAILEPNLELPARLLGCGEQTAVLGYLRDCHNVWQHHRLQIEEWIRLIENGEKPDFQITRVVGTEDRSSLSYRLSMQWMRTCSLEMQRTPATPQPSMSPAQVLAERERRRAKYEPRISAYIKAKLEYIEKDLAARPDGPRSDLAEPGEQE